MRTLTRTVTLFAGASLLAGVVVIATAGTASADATSGTTTLTITSSYVSTAASAGVVAAGADGASTGYDSGTGAISYAFPVTGGDANVVNFTGQLTHQGSLVIADFKTKRSIKVTDLRLDYINNVVSGQLPGVAGQTALFDLDGFGASTSSPTAQSYTASALDWDAAGAAALDQALRTAFIKAGATAGSFATSYTVSS